MGGIMKQKKRKDDTGLYMRQWNMELKETISRNMVAYEQKVKECKELKKQNNELKRLCNNYEKEHETTFEEWKAVIEEYKKLQNNRDKAIEVINTQLKNAEGGAKDNLRIIKFNLIKGSCTFEDLKTEEDYKYILKGDSDE